MSGKLREPIHRSLWAKFSFFGEPAYADSGLCLIGAPPSWSAEQIGDDAAKRLEKAIAHRDAPMAFKRRDTQRERVYFREFAKPIDSRYYDHVLATFPNATFHIPKQKRDTNPIPIKSDGKIVGAVMFMWW